MFYYLSRVLSAYKVLFDNKNNFYFWRTYSVLGTTSAPRLSKPAELVWCGVHVFILHCGAEGQPEELV